MAMNEQTWKKKGCGTSILGWLGIGLAAGVLAVLCALIPGQANAFALTPRGGPILGPGNAFYESPLHVCTLLGHESTGYVEQNSLTDANCALGYAQFTVNTPYIEGKFVLNLGGTAYYCGTATTGLVIDQVNCAVLAATPTATP